jgi:DNA-binding PadR family transcriptional regulator
LPRRLGAETSNEIWDALVQNYDLIMGAQISNSFVILMALGESERLTASEISKVIVTRTGGKIYKVPATLHDSIIYRLQREGFVERSSKDLETGFKITTKGRRLLRGWISFVSGCG